MKIKIILLFFSLVFSAGTYAQSGFPFDNEIRGFKHQDSLDFPKPGGILFTGSSSIRLWNDLEQRFPGKPIIKRGVGGSQISQLVKYYAPYILFPYKPHKIFIYDGENDIVVGRSAEFVADEFAQLYTMVNKALPHTEIYYMSIKSSPSRIKYAVSFNWANELIKTYLKDKPKGHYIDVSMVILDKQTLYPDSALFKPDYLHLNSKGYDKWQQILQPYVK